MTSSYYGVPESVSQEQIHLNISDQASYLSYQVSGVPSTVLCQNVHMNAKEQVSRFLPDHH